MKEKTTYYDNEIVQIISAPPGWRVMFGSFQEGGEPSYEPVACFALVKRILMECHSGLRLRDEGLEIHPVIGGEVLDVASDISNFLAVIGPEQEKDS